jgi:hypothetical protein
MSGWWCDGGIDVCMDVVLMVMYRMVDYLNDLCLVYKDSLINA